MLLPLTDPSELHDWPVYNFVAISIERLEAHSLIKGELFHYD
jgi:hypothetical protein